MIGSIHDQIIPDLESKTGPFEPKPFGVVNRFPVPVFVGIKGSIFSCQKIPSPTQQVDQLP